MKICISNERVWHFLQENEVTFSMFFVLILDGIFEKNDLTNSAVLAVECYIAYQGKGGDVIYKKIKHYFQKLNFENFKQN